MTGLAIVLQLLFAQADDLVPKFGRDGPGDGPALLAAFIRSSDPSSAAAWDALKGWTESSGDPCSMPWEGVRCSAGAVTEVRLQQRPDLKLQLGPALGSLRSLRTLALTNLGLFGTIPRELGNLTTLRLQLVIDFNPSLSGTIPHELGKLASLQNFLIYSNPRLSGTIPPEVGNLVAQNDQLLLSNRKISGTIPRELSKLIHLREL